MHSAHGFMKCVNTLVLKYSATIATRRDRYRYGAKAVPHARAYEAEPPQIGCLRLQACQIFPVSLSDT